MALRGFAAARVALRADYGSEPGPELVYLRRQVAAGQDRRAISRHSGA